MTDYDRTPAINLDAEAELIGAVLMANVAYTAASEFVSADDFFDPIHQATWEICGDLIKAGRTATPVTCKTYIPTELLVAPGVTAAQYLARMAAVAAPASRAAEYAQVVRDMADRRRLGAIGDRLVLRQGAAPIDHPIDPLAAEAIGDLDKLLSGRSRQYTPQVTIGQAAGRALDAASLAYQRDGALAGVTWGLRALDKKTLGMQPGELIIAAARPGMGKSALALTVARKAAAAGNGVLFVSLEMGDVMLAQRAIADEMFDSHALTYYRIKAGRFSEADFGHIRDAAERLRLLPLTIEQRPALGIGQISAIARQHKRQHGLGLLIIDHLHLVKSSEHYRGNKVAEVGEVSNGLKAIAKDLNIPVLALCQLSRDVEKRDNKRPTLADLRWAGEIEQDADMVMMLYREAYYLARNATGSDDAAAAKITDVMNVLEILIEKQRQGPVGPVKVFCNIECNAVRDIVEDRQPTDIDPELF